MTTDTIQWPDPATLEWDPKTMNAQFGTSTDLRNEPRRMIRFDCTSSNGFALPGGTRARFGQNTVLVYESEMPKIRKLFPTDEERATYKRAQAKFQTLLEGLAKDIDAPKGSSDEVKMELAKQSIATSVHGVYNHEVNILTEKMHACPVRAYPCVDNLVECEVRVAPPRTPEGAAIEATRSSREDMAFLLKEMGRMSAEAQAEAIRATGEMIAKALSKQKTA